MGSVFVCKMMFEMRGFQWCRSCVCGMCVALVVEEFVL